MLLTVLSPPQVHFHQELLIFFWKFCEHNKKFLFYVLKSSDVLDILVPILHYLNDARADQSRAGLMHIGKKFMRVLRQVSRQPYAHWSVQARAKKSLSRQPFAYP